MWIPCIIEHNSFPVLKNSTVNVLQVNMLKILTLPNIRVTCTRWVLVQKRVECVQCLYPMEKQRDRNWTPIIFSYSRLRGLQNKKLWRCILFQFGSSKLHTSFGIYLSSNGSQLQCYIYKIKILLIFKLDNLSYLLVH